MAPEQIGGICFGFFVEESMIRREGLAVDIGGVARDVYLFVL